jgi:Ceramidase
MMCPRVVGIFRVRVIASASVHSTTRTRSNDRASVRFNPCDGCADASGTLGPSHGYFGLVRGAPLQLYASDISLSLLSLSFCLQANYQFSHYVAEISNTLSNLFFVCISLYGARLSSRESLPTRYLVGFAVRLFAQNCHSHWRHSLLFHLLIFLRYLVGVCFGRAGKHSFPRNTPL